MNLFYYTSGRALKDSEYNIIQKLKEEDLLKKIEKKRINYLILSQGFKEPYEEFNSKVNIKIRSLLFYISKK